MDTATSIKTFETELVSKLADFIRYDWHKRTQEDDTARSVRSNESSSESRLAVIGTVAYESVSIGFCTVESMEDVIEMAEVAPPAATIKRVRFGVEEESYGDEGSSSSSAEAERRSEMRDLGHV